MAALADAAEWEAARAAAAAVARAAGHPFLGTEHLLLGILQQRDTASSALFARYGLSYDAVYDQWAAMFLPAAAGGQTAPGVARPQVRLMVTPQLTGDPPVQPLADGQQVFTPKAAQALAAAADGAGGVLRLPVVLLALLGAGGICTPLLVRALEVQGRSRAVLTVLDRELRALLDHSAGS